MSLAREVRRLALPAIVHSLLQTLVFVVDRVMLGRHGEGSLAAMQLGGALEWSLWSVFASFEVGTIARVGRHVGAGDKTATRRAALLSFAMAAVFGTVLLALSPFAVRLLPLYAPDVSPSALDEASGYLAIAMGASPIVFVATTATATLQGGGDTKTPLLIGIFANVVHVGLNRVLILGLGPIPAYGARGAAVSTVVTFAIEALLATWALTSTKRGVSLRRVAPVADRPARHAAVRDEARELLRIATPALVERVLYHVGYAGFIYVIARLGDDAMAANQSLISVESICFLSGDGFGVAAAALVAQKLGATQPLEARRVAWLAARDAAATLTAFGLVAFALRDHILPIFSANSDVVSLGRSAMLVLALAQPFMGTSVVLSQALRGAGRTREALVISVIGAFVVRLAATWYFAMTLGLGLVGVWLGSTADWIVRTTLLVLLMFRDRSRLARASVSASVA